MSDRICPTCLRHTSIQSNGRWMDHLLPGVEKSSTELATYGDRYCPMSSQLVSRGGDDPKAHEHRLKRVLDLAVQLRDGDPAIVWSVLTAMDAVELQRIAMFALAGIDVDRPRDALYGWVLDLPAAKVSA